MNCISKEKLDDCIRLAKKFKRLYDDDLLIGVSVIGFPGHSEIHMEKETFNNSFSGSGEWFVDEEADYYRKQVVIEDVVFFALFDREVYENEKIQENR